MTVLDIAVVFGIARRQTEDSGIYKLKSITGDLESTINEAENVTALLALSAQPLLDDPEALEDFIYEQKDALANGESGLFNIYIAGTSWDILPGLVDRTGFVATKRNWYIGAAKTPGKAFVTSPYVDVVTGNLCYTVSIMLADNDTVLSVDYTMKNIQDHIMSLSDEGIENAVIVTSDGIVAGSTEMEMVGKRLVEVHPEYEGIFSLAKSREGIQRARVRSGLFYDNLFAAKTDSGWYIIESENDWELYKESYRMIIFILIMTVVFFGLILFLYILSEKNKKRAENSANAVEHNKLTLKEHGSANKRISKTVVLFMIGVMIVSLYMNMTATYRWGNQRMQSDANSYSYRLSEWVTTQKSILDMFCDVISANPSILDDYDYTVKFLDSITRQYSQISVSYMANPDFDPCIYMNNGWIPGPDFKVEDRPWYKDTMASESGWSISAPYFDAQTGLYCVTFSERVYDEKSGDFLGTFAIDFYMEKLIAILGDSYSTDGYAFLADAQGEIINHPYGLYQMSEESITNVSDFSYGEVNADNSSTIFFRDYDGAYKILIAKRNDDSNFVVYVVSNFLRIYGRMLIYSIVIIVSFVLCIMLAYRLFTSMIMREEKAKRSIQKAADAAIAADNAKSHFLAQMSHEIRTPINAVLGMNEMILRESSDKGIKEYASNIKASGNTLLSLINSILDFSKIEDGKMEIIPVKYDLADLVNNLVNSISERAKNKGLEFDVKVAETLPRGLLGDDVRITQIIMNLLTNAVKYTEKGSVILSIGEGTRNGKEAELAVSVTDTGIGIRKEEIPKLFDSFKRLDEKKNRNIEGTGLGMSIVAGLLGMMGSSIEVESVYGKGSTFSFVLRQQIIDEAPIGDYRERVAEKQKGKVRENLISAVGAKVLIVDDNDMNLKVAKGLLKLFGIEPKLVSSGAEAIEVVKKEHYDIIFLDHMMPIMDGIECLGIMREEGLITENTAVIALTANAVMGAREHYLSASFDDYLSKPIELKQLNEKLKDFLPKEKFSEGKTAN